MNIFVRFWNWLTRKNKKTLVIEPKKDIVGRNDYTTRTNSNSVDVYRSRNSANVSSRLPSANLSQSDVEYHRRRRNDDDQIANPPLIIGDIPVWLPPSNSAESASGGFGKSDGNFSTGGGITTGSFVTGGTMDSYSSSSDSSYSSSDSSYSSSDSSSSSD